MLTLFVSPQSRARDLLSKQRVVFGASEATMLTRADFLPAFLTNLRSFGMDHSKPFQFLFELLADCTAHG